jgi:radical SAM superfamily enzyme YgiQ (UPF0313 family)
VKVAIVYPPVLKDGRYPLLSQNRHLKFSASREVRIFPLIPASAATLVKAAGHEVLWLDGINTRLTPEGYREALDAFAPDLVVLETKAPVIEAHWAHIAEEKGRFPQRLYALAGDHVSYFPEESLLKSPVDFVLAGGDFDLETRDLAEHLAGRGPWPLGVWGRQGRELRKGAHRSPDADLDALPFIDRGLTRWRDYGEAYLLPGAAYILSGRGCGLAPGRASACTFCIWQHAFWEKTARLRSPESVVEEIARLKALGAREVFDDNETGPIWDRKWMLEFHDRMHARGLAGTIALSTNARGDLIDADLAKLMKATGFRLLKIGIEAGDDESLRRLAKLEGLERIKAGIRAARDQGLVTLLTAMVGYPWQDEAGVRRTYDAAREMLLYRPKFGDCLQASVVVPYPGSPLWREAVAKGWFLGDPLDYASYDMARPLLKTPVDPAPWVRKFWRLHLHPSFLAHSLWTLRGRDQRDLAWRGLRSLAGHVRDY